MRKMAPMKTAKIGYIILSVLLCAVGLGFVIHPIFSVKAVGFLCGGLCILFGAFKLVGYFSRDLYRLAFQYDLAFGLLIILLGFVLFMRPAKLLQLINIMLGIAVLADGLFKIQMATDARRFGLSKWWLILMVAICAAAAGLLLVLRPVQSSTALMVLLGISLMAEGVLNFCTAITAVKIIRHQQPDVVEVYWHEEGDSQE